jgi:hypothetical protein
VAEIELRRSLPCWPGSAWTRRLAHRATLEREVAAWAVARNAAGRGVDWRFMTGDARLKLKHPYPVIQG